MTLPNGYEMQSTFFLDFSIADRFGVEAIEDTYARAFSEWKSNYIYLTELVLVLNWKIWEHWEKDNNSPIAKLYNRLWQEADEYAMNNLKGEEMSHFLRVTD